MTGQNLFETNGSDFDCVSHSVKVPNPLFDLAGITCGHFLVPFWTFFGATLIGKAIIKVHIQVTCACVCGTVCIPQHRKCL